MTDPEAESPSQDDPPLNRAQRREQARGKGRTSPRRQDNFRTLEENQDQAETVGSAASTQSDAPPEATAGETRLTGAGTGGATESAGRVLEHEAKNPEKNQPNS
jgi:hypothetical protein